MANRAPEYSTSTERIFSRIPEAFRIADAAQTVPEYLSEITEKVNLVPNPRGRTTDGEVTIYENLVSNPRGRNTSGTVTIWENLVTNPRGRNTSGTVVVRENLAVQPWGYGVRNSTVTTIENGVAITDHPLDIATAHESRLTEGETSSILLSSYNVGAGGNFTEPVWAGTWVKVNAPGYQARMGSGESYEPIPANEWVFIHTTSASTGWVSTHIQTDDFRTPAPEDRAWLTGTIDSTTPISGPEDYLDGDTSPDTDLTPAWTGTLGESTSQLTAPKPVGWSSSNALVYYSESRDAIAAIPRSASTVQVYVLGIVANPSTIISEITNGTSEPLMVSAWEAGNVRSDVDLEPGESASVRAPGGGGNTNLVGLQLAGPAAGTVIGQPLYFRAAVIDGTDTYDGEWFDGHQNSPDPDWTMSWSGGVDASSSVLTAPGLAGISVPAGYTGYYSTSRDAIALTSPGQAYITFNGLTTPNDSTMLAEIVDTSDGQPVTMDLYRLTPKDGAGQIEASVGGTIHSGIPSTSAGSYVWLIPTFSMSGRTVYFRAAVIDGTDTYDGEWFDGHQNSPDPDWTMKWSGAVDGSSSLLTAPKPVGWTPYPGVGAILYYSASQDAIAAMTASPGTATYVTAQSMGGRVAGDLATSVYEVWTSGPSAGVFILHNAGWVDGPVYSPTVTVGATPGTLRLGGESSGGIARIYLSTTGKVYFRAALIDGTTEYREGYFDGDTNRPAITYEWDGPPHNSPSRRVYRAERLGGYPLKRFISSVGDVMGDIDVLTARMMYVPVSFRDEGQGEFPVVIPGRELGATSDLADARTADSAWLPWLAQLVGIDTREFLTDEEIREAIESGSSGFMAGSKQAIEDAVRSELTGTRDVAVYPNSDATSPIGTATEWDVLIITRASETPGFAQVVNTVNRKKAKPAGVVLHHLVFLSSWEKIEAELPTWEDWEGKSWNTIEESGLE